MSRMIRTLALPLSVSAMGALACAPASFAAASVATPLPAPIVQNLIAHRAVYDLSLASSTGERAPASASGRIAFDFTGSACEGWVMNFRQVTTMQPSEGEQRTTDLHSSTFEDGDAQNFRFKMETAIQGSAHELVDGTAHKSKDGALSLDLSRPARAKLDLAQEVVFPTEQIVRILQEAHAGHNTAEMDVYDGSETGQKIFHTLSVIGHPAAKPPTDKAALASSLATTPRWPVAVSYFDVKNAAGTPDYVLSFDLYDNGVSGALRLDYGDFVLKGELVDFAPLPQKPCAK